MSTTGLITALFLALPTVIVAYLGVRAWQVRRIPGAISFMAMMAIMEVWSLSALLVVISTGEPAARSWLTVMLMTVPYLPVAIFATAAHTSSHAGLLRRPWYWRLIWLIIPTITATLMFTNASHQFYMYDIVLVPSDGHYIGWTNRNGAWSIVHLTYSYALVLYSIMLLIRHFVLMRFRTYRVRTLLLLFGLGLAFASNAYSTLSPVHTFITPVVFNVTAPLLYWALVHYRLFDLTPIARHQAFEQMQDAIIILDTEQRVVDVNRSALALAVQEPVIGQPFAACFPAFQDVLTGAAPSVHQMLRVDAEELRHYDLRVSSIERDAVVAGTIIVLRDVTERQRAEEHAHRLEIERERTRGMAEFVTAASHEFRTPLTIISNASYLISRTDDSAKRAERLTQINQQVTALTQLVAALVELVSLNADVKLDFQAADLNTLVRTAAENLRALAKTRNQHIDMHLAPIASSISGHPAHLLRAFQAVLHNALRFSPADSHIIVRSMQDDEHILISIEDKGIGISPENLPRIFDAFFRADAAHSTPGFGTGLTIAQRVVELHGGTIHASSTLGAGTIIEMRFPLKSRT
ncbi:MAG: PAS domain-containing protein [Anaerolineae bacterium]|nr:PAS domain-containing protein [Anaerolineae bacterium]